MTRFNVYLAGVVAVLTAAAGLAVFYLTAFTTADPEWFKAVSLTGFGALIGLLIPKINPPG